MANDSQRDKARATFGKTFFENSKALPNPKNAAAALQKRANDRPIPTYKVGGVVKKNKPPQPTAAEREADRKRREEYAKMKVTPENAAAITRGNRAAAIEGGRYKKGGKVEQDFTGLMKKAADRAAAKGTPVMKQGGATDEYTAKRVMSRIKAGNFKDGGRAELLRDRRMKDIEKDYKIALAKGKNEGVAKAKYEQRKADAADDYAKRTKADRTTTKAGEKAAEAALTEARRTKGESIKKRDMANDINKFFAGKDMTPKAAPAKAAEPAAAKPSSFNAAFKAERARLGPGKTFTYNGKSYTTNLAGEGTKAPKPARPVVTKVKSSNAAAPAAAAPAAASAKPAASMVASARPAMTGAIPTSAALSSPAFLAAARADTEAKKRAEKAKADQAKAKQAAENTKRYTSRNVQSAYGAVGTKLAKGGKVEKFAVGGVGKVRKGMMKGK
jgi:hypothetical protein